MSIFSKHAGRLALVAALSVGSLTVAACDSAEDRLAGYVESGDQLSSEGEFDKATIEYRNALAIDANSVPAHLGIAAIYEQRANYPAMMAHLNKVLEVEAKNVTALVKLGQLLMLSGKLEDAQGNADTALGVEPDNVAALVLKAGVALRLGNAEIALTNAKKAIELDPANPTAHAVLIGERLKEEDFAGALAIADDITARAPDDFGVALVKLQVIEQSGDQDGAGEYLKKMVDQFPDQYTLRTALARWYISKEDMPAAEAQLRAISEAKPDDNGAAMAVVQFILQSRGKEAAAEELTKLVASRTDNTDFEVALARLDYDNGETDKAKAALKAVIQGAVNSGNQEKANEVRLVLASFALRENDKAAASELVKQVLQGDETNVEALTIRAAIHYDDGDYSAALLDIRAALASAPNNEKLLLLSARTQQKTGNQDIAGENYAAAMQASEYSPAITLEYVRFLVAANRTDAIVTVLNEAVRRHPENRELLTTLADIQLRTGDWVGADQTAQSLAGIDNSISKRIQAATLSGREKYDESLAILNELAQDPGQSATTLAETVQVYFRAGKIDEAFDFLNGVITENPKNVQALMLRATLHASQDQLAETEADFRAAIAADPKAGAPSLALARFYNAQGKPDEAMVVLKEGIETATRTAGLRLLLAGMHEVRQEVDASIEQYREVLKEQPGSLVAINNLVNQLIEYKADDPAALAEATKVGEPLKGSEIPAFQDTYGWSLYKAGDYEQALRYLRPAAEGLADNPYVRFHIGMAYAKLNEADQAREHLEFAAAADPATFNFVEEAKAALAALPAAQ